MDAAVILVTGGAVRIGREICMRLSDCGYTIAIHYNSSENEASNLADIINSKGGRAACFSGNLLDQSMPAKLFEEIKQELGPVSGVVNNASLFNFDDISNVSLESWNRHMHVNALSPTLLISELSRNLPSGMVGSVVNILDQKISQPNPDYLSYTASRFAMAGLTETLARGLAPSIRVNAVAPGHTLPSPEQTMEGFEKAQSQSPLQSGPSATDIAEAVVYLMSAKSVTGQIIYADSGERFLSRSRDVVFETEE
tara:strand:+ start:53 stop:814 length:762 start_codon:yes stop_codon:yes gene_type:complete